MSKIEIIIDGKKVAAKEGEVLLFRALEAGFFIPNLCAIKGSDSSPASCRLCFVEIEGMDRPVTSCTVRVREGMVVRTRSEAVDRLVASAFEMLLSVHRIDCKTCPGNGRCALQEIAKKRRLPLKPKRLPKIEPDLPVDESRPEIGLNPNHCVLCGQCVHVCNNVVQKKVLDFINRGLATRVETFDGEPLAEQVCGDCVACAEVCPVGAIYLRNSSDSGS